MRMLEAGAERVPEVQQLVSQEEAVVPVKEGRQSKLGLVCYYVHQKENKIPI